MFELQSFREFSPLDEMLPPIYFAYLLCFPITSGEENTISTLLQDSLSALVAERPYLTGRAKRDDSGKARPGHLVLEIPDPLEDTRIVFNDLTDPDSGFKDTYQQLQAAGMPLHKLDARALAPLTAGIGETRTVFSAQANFIRGGLLLATCFHHNFVDAYGAARIIARWSEHCDGSAAPQAYGAEPNDGMPDVLDVGAIKASYDYDTLKHVPELWRLNCLDWRERPEDYVPFEWPIVLPSLLPPRDPPVTSSMYSFSSHALADLKRLASPSCGDGWVSTNDALVAFLWRHVIRARFPWSVEDPRSGNKDDVSSVVVALDGRKDLSLSPSYIGNCLFHCFTDLPIRYIGGEDTALRGIAVSIRETVNKTRDKKLLTDVVALAATLPSCQSMHYGADNLGKDFYTTSWIDLPLYQLSWGPLGRTDFFRIPEGHFESLCCILPPRHGDGVVDVIISVEHEHGVRLSEDKEFARFAKLVSPVE